MVKYFSATNFMLAFIALEGTYCAPIDSTTTATTPMTGEKVTIPPGSTTNDQGAFSNTNMKQVPVHVPINVCGNTLDTIPLNIPDCPQQ